jgi:hypothetical protein
MELSRANVKEPVLPQRESNDLKLLEYCYCNLNKKFKNYALNLVNFSKFEGIPSWIGLLFFGAWFQLFGLFWMVTGLPIFRPLPVLMKLNTESALLD